MKLIVISALVLALAAASALANGNGTSSPAPPSLGHPGSKIYVMSKFENVDTSGPAVSPAVTAHGAAATKGAAGAGRVRVKRQYGPRGNYGRPQPGQSRYYQRAPYRYRPQPYARPYYRG